MPSYHSTYVLEIPVMRMQDWVTRHDRFWSLHNRTRDAIACRMGPNELICGTDVAAKVKPGTVIKLPDKLQRLTKQPPKRPRETQLRLCQL